MAKLGTQGRLQIPADLANLIHLNQGKIGIFWDNTDKTIFISNLSDKQEENCLAIRSLDDKNRVVIKSDLLKLIEADKDTELVITAKRGRIYIINPKKDTV